MEAVEINHNGVQLSEAQDFGIAVIFGANDQPPSSKRSDRRIAALLGQPGIPFFREAEVAVLCPRYILAKKFPGRKGILLSWIVAESLRVVIKGDGDWLVPDRHGLAFVLVRLACRVGPGGIGQVVLVTKLLRSQMFQNNAVVSRAGRHPHHPHPHLGQSYVGLAMKRIGQVWQGNRVG